MKKKIETYTLKEFINNILDRKNMFRYDKVVIDFTELNNKHMSSEADDDIIYSAMIDGINYDVIISSSCKIRRIAVKVNGYIFDIGFINWPLESEVVTVELDCDALFC